MKWITICFAAAIMSCCGTKARKANAEKIHMAQEQSSTTDTLPNCIQEMIQRFEKENIQNPPRKIFSYQYNGSRVYYVTPPCCDFFSELYDGNCNLIGHPDGGFTGKGDGKLPDFSPKKKDEKLIWEDKREQASKK